jgi:hypothetical protein
MNQDTLVRRRDGKLEERVGEDWVAEYSENSDSGLWEAEVFKHDVPEWHGLDFGTLEQARAPVWNFHDQS